MWKSILISISLFSILFSSCRDEVYAPPAFPVTRSVDGQCISEELLLQYPLDCCVCDDYILVLALVDNKWVQVYDKKSGKHLASLVGRGQAPEELSSGVLMDYDEEGKQLFIYDNALMKALCFRVVPKSDGLLSFVDAVNLNTQNGAVRRAWSLGGRDEWLIDGQLGAMPGEQKRFQILSDGKVTAEYNNFPVEEKPAFLYSHVALSPNRTRMAVGTLFGGILEFHDVMNTGIKPRQTRMFYPPVYDFAPGAVTPTEETIFGFADLCATNDKLYAVLIGDKNPNRTNNISVFNWDGEEEATYQTNCLVVKLCCSEAEPGIVYGIAFSEAKEFYLASFDLNTHR